MARPVRKGKNWPYRSGLEVKMAAHLKGAGVKFAYEQDTFSIETDIPKVFCADCSSTSVRQKSVYTPDFRVGKHPFTYLEGKGRLTAKEKRRIAGLLRAHPGLDFRLVFQRNNPIYPRSKTKYLDWAKDVGIPACIGPAIPDEWVTEFLGTQKAKKRRRNA